MAREERRETTREEPVREREVIVTDRDRGSSFGGVIAAIIGVIVVGLIAWFLIVGFGGEGDSLNVEMPEEVNVDTGGAEGGGGDGGGDTGDGG